MRRWGYTILGLICSIVSDRFMVSGSKTHQHYVYFMYLSSIWGLIWICWVWVNVMRTHHPSHREYSLFDTRGYFFTRTYAYYIYIFIYLLNLLYRLHIFSVRMKCPYSILLGICMLVLIVYRSTAIIKYYRTCDRKSEIIVITN